MEQQTHGSSRSPGSTLRRRSSSLHEVTQEYLEDISTEQIHEDIKDTDNIRQLSDESATRDKYTFALLMFVTILTAYIAGAVPQYFFYWHSLRSVVYHLYRYYSYKPIGWHYILLDLCHVSDALFLIYIWSPWKMGWLFPVNFMFSNGPMLFSIVLWRNSLVPHSIHKMTTLYVHLSPALATVGIRWYSTPEQGFLLCSDPSEPGPRGCDHLGIVEMFFWPVIVYLIWLFSYIFIVLFWRKKEIDTKKYVTTIGLLTDPKKKRFLVNEIIAMCGDRYPVLSVFVSQFFIIVILILSAGFSYHWKWYGITMVFFMIAAACYNGATFYIDVLGRKYYEDKERTN